MNKHIEAFDQRLISLFNSKAKEFEDFSQTNPKTAPVINQIAQLYLDLVNLLQK